MSLDAQGVRVQAAQLQVHAKLDVLSAQTLGVSSRGAPELREFRHQAQLATPGARPWGRLRYRLLPDDSAAAQAWDGLAHTTGADALSPMLHTDQEAQWQGEADFEHL